MNRYLKIRVQLLVILIIELGAISSLVALDPTKTINQYGHNAWVRQNGLPANAANVALQTRDGYLWIGTSAGLFRFDGNRFQQVSTDPEDSKNLESVTALCEGKDGTLWIGTGFNSICRLKDGVVRRFTEADGIMGRNIHAVFESRRGYIWLSTSFGLYRFGDGKFISVPITPNNITGIAEDSVGRIWVGTHDGVRVFQEEQPKQILSITMKNGLPNKVTTWIYTDRKGSVWIGTVDGLVRCREGKLKTFTTADGLSNNQINSIYEDRDGNLWVGTRGGLSRFCEGKWNVYKASDGLTDDNVLFFTEDREGSLWVCTSNGLNQFKNVNITTYTTYEGLDNDYVSSVLETKDGALCILSDQGSSVTKIKNGKIKIFHFPVGTIFPARDGSLWIGQYGQLVHMKNSKIERFDTTAGLPVKFISAISEDDKSLILFLDAIGVRRYINGKLEPYMLADGKIYSSTEFVACFYYDPEGVLWIGRSRGLVRIKDGVSTMVGEAEGMSNLWVNSIYDDRQGNLWIASPLSGLLRYRDGKFTTYNTKAGLFTNEIYCVLGDNQGDLWLSSPRGIGRLSRKELDDYADGRINQLHPQVYLIADGMKTDECFGNWQPAEWKTQDGHLWFATKKGAVMIDPKSFKKNELAPPVFIENVIVDGRVMSSQFPLIISPETDKFEFHYTALSYLVPERVLFKYRLEGYDKEWVDVQTRRVAYYTNLPPGDYRFRVMACNNDSVWNEAGASYEFTLKPHFYQTYLFYGLTILFLIGIIYGVIQLRLWQHVKKEEVLHKRIHEAMANIKMLGGLIPICAHCKKIRDDRGYWDRLEEYIQDHSEAKFSHSICPECMEKFYPKVSQTKKSSEI